MTDRVQMIDGERVYCVRRQVDMDVERCLACPDLKEVRLDGNERVVVCTAAPKRKREVDPLFL